MNFFVKSPSLSKGNVLGTDDCSLVILGANYNIKSKNVFTTYLKNDLALKIALMYNLLADTP